VTDLHLILPAIPQSVGAARRAVRDHVGVAGASAALLLCVSELVANAVRHAYPDTPGDVELAVSEEDGVVAVSVTDHGVGFSEVAEPGLGLMIVESLSEAMSCDRLPGGGTRVVAWVGTS
jgi:anti-sigma regulatory factor (Ser/Thr protein kinase)